jgi:hypothetical protein
MPQIYLTGFQPTQEALLMKGTAAKDIIVKPLFEHYESV